MILASFLKLFSGDPLQYMSFETTGDIFSRYSLFKGKEQKNSRRMIRAEESHPYLLLKVLSDAHALYICRIALSIVESGTALN